MHGSSHTVAPADPSYFTTVDALKRGRFLELDAHPQAAAENSGGRRARWKGLLIADVYKLHVSSQLKSCCPVSTPNDGPVPVLAIIDSRVNGASWFASSCQRAFIGCRPFKN